MKQLLPEDIDVKKFRNVLLIGGSGTGKTTKAKEIMRKVKRSDPSVKVLVISPNSEYRDVAEELGLAYLEPERLGLDPIKLHRLGLVSDFEVKTLITDHLCRWDVDLNMFESVGDLTRSRVFEGEIIEPEGDTVLSLRKFVKRDLEMAGLLIPVILKYEMLHGDLSNAVIVADNADKIFGTALEDLMRAVRKTGNTLVAVLQDPILNGEIRNIVSLADAVLLFHYGIEDLWMLRDALNLDEETVHKIVSARIGEAVLITNNKQNSR